MQLLQRPLHVVAAIPLSLFLCLSFSLSLSLSIYIYIYIFSNVIDESVADL